jgi:glycoside/pentoside/hexuronide:cation symporter, GPH family
METSQKKISTAERTLSLKEKMAYGMGDLGNNFLFDLGQIYLLKFYTDVLGLPAVAAGMVFLVSKIFDAFSDITIGTWIDSRKIIGKRGKFRPFILYGAIPLGLLTIVSFTTPDFSLNGRMVFAYVTYMAFGFCYSLVNVPYGSMGAAMTQNTLERSELAAWRNGGANLGALITTVGFIPLVLLFDDPSKGYMTAAGVFAVLGMLCLMYCSANIHERIIVEKKPEFHGSICQSFKALSQNIPLIILCIVNVCTFSAYNVKMAVQVYYCQYVLNDISMVPYMGFFSMSCVFLGIFMIPFLVKRIGKKASYIMGCGVWIVGDLLNYILPTNAVSFVALTCVAFFGSAFINSLVWAFIADAVEYGEWKTGIRSEGIVYSFFTFFRKLSQAIAGFIPGVVLAMVGYVPNALQNEETLLGLRGLMFLYPVFFAGLALLIMGKMYSLTEERFGEILSELEARKKLATEGQNH